MEKLIDQDEWDVVIIGAGPAGSAAAIEIAKSGTSVLLIDKSEFPRAKVCGSCLNLRSLSLLRKMGIHDFESRLKAPKIETFYFGADQKHVSIPFSGCSISREKFDSLLVDEAVKRGTIFLPGVRAVLEKTSPSFGTVALQRGETIQKIKSRVTLIADGLSGSALKSGMNIQPKRLSRIGIGTIVREGPIFYRPGTIYMAYGKNSYVGLVRLEDGRIDIAAALRPEQVKVGIKENVCFILEEANFPEIKEIENSHWLGTSFLTRTRKTISGERFFVIGDAASYTEPFTGEGISWALAGGIAVAPLVREALLDWSCNLIQKWQHRYHSLIRRRQMVSKLMMNSLRKPFVVRWGMRLVDRFPFLGSALVQEIQKI